MSAISEAEDHLKIPSGRDDVPAGVLNIYRTPRKEAKVLLKYFYGGVLIEICNFSVAPFRSGLWISDPFWDQFSRIHTRFQTVRSKCLKSKPYFRPKRLKNHTITLSVVPHRPKWVYPLSPTSISFPGAVLPCIPCEMIHGNAIGFLLLMYLYPIMHYRRFHFRSSFEKFANWQTVISCITILRPKKLVNQYLTLWRHISTNQILCTFFLAISITYLFFLLYSAVMS